MLLQHHLESAKDADLSSHNVARAEAPHTKWSSGTALHVNAVYSEERSAFILSGFLLDHEYLEHEANAGPDLLILHSGDRSEVAGECRYVVRVDSGVPAVVVLDAEDGTRVLRPTRTPISLGRGFRSNISTSTFVREGTRATSSPKASVVMM